MRMVFALVLLVGLGLAGFAVFVAQGRFAAYQNERAQLQQALQAARQVELTKIWVTKRAVGYGERLTKDDMALVDWPKSAVPPGAFVGEENAPHDGQSGRLRAVVRAMEPFEPILAVKVTEPGEDAGVNSRLGKGMRAFAIRVDVASGVSGFLRPGDRVDVYWTGRVRGADEMTRLILDGVSLIAVDQTANSELSNPTVARTVTVEVSPQDAAALAQAQSTGKLTLALLGVGDETETGRVEVDQNSLLGIEAAAPIIPVAERPKCTVRTRRGADVEFIEIPCPDES